MTPVGATAVEHHGGVFARYFIELPIDPKRVERALTEAPESWLRDVASEANHRGDTLLAEIGFGDRVRVARTVAIELGDPVHTAGKVVLPLRWTPTDAPGLFPALEADLEVAPLPPDRTQLAMSARYVPPLGPLGKAIDRAILYRVAEATLKDFLDRVGEALAREAGGDGPGSRATPAVAG
jgi:hypothetical protein